MLLQELAEVSRQVAATSARLEKRQLIADLLTRTPPVEIEIATAYLSGVLPQRRTGVGWRSLESLPSAAEASTVHLVEVDATLERLSSLAGPGSAGQRQRDLEELLVRLTIGEQEHLRALLTGGLRQGAQDALMLEAIALAADLPVRSVRRAAMFSAPTGPVARAALLDGIDGLARFGLVAGRPVRPMLAASAPDPVAAVTAIAGPFVADTKLDGIRIQVHKVGQEVSVFTRSLDEISERLPGVVATVRELPARQLILDGEALGLDGGTETRPFFFDVLLVDDDALLEQPLATRLARLDLVVPPQLRTQRLSSATAAETTTFFERMVAEGQEGIVLKRLDAPYAAGRRGAAWVKVKPRHTLDLVVLAVEWGSGRRQGKLSNIHLGARDPSGSRWLMLGKTFKGMTDEMLHWQTERFLSLETRREGHVVHLRPEQVVEIAFDSIRPSTRYPGGVGFRFARVLRYRDDKTAAEADSIDAVYALCKPQLH